MCSKQLYFRPLKGIFNLEFSLKITKRRQLSGALPPDPLYLMGALPPNPRWGEYPPRPPFPHFIQIRPTAVLFCRSLFDIFTLFVWPLYCLPLRNLQVLITTLVSSNCSYIEINNCKHTAKLQV